VSGAEDAGEDEGDDGDDEDDRRRVGSAPPLRSGGVAAFPLKDALLLGAGAPKNAPRLPGAPPPGKLPPKPPDCAKDAAKEVVASLGGDVDVTLTRDGAGLFGEPVLRACTSALCRSASGPKCLPL